ncbi:alpha-amylase family glycosyl hydrolase [Cellulosilyticum lentocellum]|uniref:Isoamylase n=1 Tax=Cellulosilyticum lentocellum (strain ATCC 49066 / DSM 5427 / NCIMB 11756 / RHM5) TaxID=642492 RepID=F2JQC5_CELLD|nr:alpha-amylase family glycosyl hydrolase [Cellulosilyticum lentocellum]ADZ83787.1 Isoamylase [Cellulosilyticum lentocellum DSM 5427]
MYGSSVGQSVIGCHFTEMRTHLGVYTTIASKMLLEIYEEARSIVPITKVIMDAATYQKDNVFSIQIEGLKEGMAYVWRIVHEDYSYSPSIMDPYAKGTFFFQGEWRNIIKKTNRYHLPKPQIPWEETILYEMHVGHFTMNNKTLSNEKRGTFIGLMQQLPYLKQLGVTTLELLPIFKWNAYTLKNRNPQTGELLEDVWGYNPVGFFCVDERFSVSKESSKAIDEFKLLVEKAHEEGLEIILDVVYNHTGEGGEDGTAFHFKYLAPKVYYKYNDKGQFLNCSGTGNTLNTNHSIVKKFIIDSLVYWSEEVGVDGFRFDLASILGQDECGRWIKTSLLNEIAEHPLLGKVKLISESWDAKGSYDVGRMPYPFREWSDYFRDTMRQFVKGDQGKIKALADCIQGKEVYFTDLTKGTSHMIHFITAHDGFTMWDLLSYNDKHNEANGEGNRDGHNANYSYNWGVEGTTEDTNILEARKRGMRNLMCLLILAQGVPMLLMGDEIGRTQGGNNNAFCQNNESVWMDWERVTTFKSQYLFVQRLIALRKSLDYFKTADKNNYKISWHGIRYNQPDWSYYSKSIACFIEGDQSLFLVANSHYESLRFEMPPSNKKWCRVIDTAYKEIEDIINEEIIEETNYEVKPYSICFFKEINHKKIG